MERTGEAFEETVRLTVVGEKLQVGMAAPAFELDTLEAGAAFPRTVTLDESRGHVRVLNVINSLDTPVCHVETRRWQDLLGDAPGVKLYTVSMDLPFAQLRWCGAEDVGHTALSSHRSERFGIDYGVLLKEWRLLQRAVFVIDGNDQVAYAEYVADQMQEPDYDAALAAVRSAQVAAV
ncbi:MAG TPA: thiol peroxidase [Longimicrobiales bacterium]|nr:thiol peroxidase [Longimicrobiales bacterium]